MPQDSKYVLVGSTQACSGKSATIIGAAYQLKNKGVAIGYGKPLGNYFSQEDAQTREEDVSFLSQALELPASHTKYPFVFSNPQTIEKRMQGEDVVDYNFSLEQYVQDIAGDIVFIEGPSNLNEGSLFNLSLQHIAEVIGAPVLLVTRFHTETLIDEILAAKQQLGERLLGVVINDVPPEEFESGQVLIKSFLEKQGIPVLGLLPCNNLLRSVSVRELVSQLDAKVLCRSDRLDLMVETLAIGAMNVNSALEYFRQGRNMGVVTGGDRKDLQMAALETSTSCLILTGHSSPHPDIIQRADDLEVPILSVDLDTLSTVEIADYAFGQVRLQEPIKVMCIQQLMQDSFDVDRFLQLLGLDPVVSV